MSKKKDCFGSETYVCRTTDCLYQSDCAVVIGEKKMERMIARRGTTSGSRSSEGHAESAISPRIRSERPVRIRSKDYIMGKAS